MSAASTFQRRVRPRQDDSEWDGQVDDQLDGSSDDGDETEQGGNGLDQTETGVRSQSDSKAGSPSDSDESDEASEEELEDLKHISFGALAKAQETLGKRKRSGNEAQSRTQEGLEGIRRRLQEMKEHRSIDTDKLPKDLAAKKKHVEHHRSSKHAPAEQTSKKPVTRKRSIVGAPKREIRDPRFEALSGVLDERKVSQNYAFLSKYRQDEAEELKRAIKKTKDEEAKNTLKRELLSIESKRKAREAKEAREEVLRKHRKKEKEAVRQGKKPFYLKKTEQKKRVLLERYQGLKGKKLDKVIERRRKKVASKEKKNMPFERRVIESS